MYLHRQPYNELNSGKWWIISFLEVISHLSTLHLLPRLCCTSSWWMNFPLSALKRTRLSAAATTYPETKNNNATMVMRDGNQWVVQQNFDGIGMNWRGFLDVKIKEMEEGEREGSSNTSFHIPPPSLCSVILPWSIMAPLIARRFSKGHSISSGSVSHLHLILFRTFVVDGELIKENLISITCCQWMMLNGVTVKEPNIDWHAHISWSELVLFPSGN